MEVALCNAMCVFWKQGYAGTSLDDLLVVMKLSKSSFYQSFKGKHALFLNCLQHYLKLTSAEFKTNLTPSTSGKLFIVGIFNETYQGR